jgi:hypothetical protein
MLRKLLLFGILLGANPLFSQISLKDSSIRVCAIHFSYAGQLPAGVLAERFGYNSNLSMAFSFKTVRNWTWAVDFSYIFGNQIKQRNIFDSIATKSEHLIIDVNGELADVRLYERGFNATAWFGKIFPVFGSNPNSGLALNLGLGFMQHHIKIEDIGNRSPQLVGDLKKGYDRLCNGPSISQYLGYNYLSNNRYVNFFLGIECTEAFTKDRRSWDYQLMQPLTEQRLDILYGLRAGWILPLYKRQPRAYYYN